MAFPRHINVVSLSFYLLIAAFIYAIVKFGPVYWTKQELDNIVSAHSFSARRKSGPEIKKDLIRDIEKKLGITLNPRDVDIDKQASYVYIYVYWETKVEHPWGSVTPIRFDIEKENNL